MNTTSIVTGVARAGLLVDLTIRTYNGKKQDKAVQEEVQHAKGAASKRATSVYKSLFAECKELDDVIKFAMRVRMTHYTLTLPWSDNGARLLPIRGMKAYKAKMDDCQAEFDTLVERFLDKYDTLIAAAAFQLGTMFNRADYPLRSQVARRFSMAVSFSPLPTSGDFRIDAEAETQQDLISQYEQRAQELVVNAQRDAWTRLHKSLTHIAERVTDEDGGKRKRIYDSLVTNPLELCSILSDLNVTNDPALERARKQLEDLMMGTSAKELRDHADARVEVKEKVQNILSQYDWGTIDDDADDDLAEAA